MTKSHIFNTDIAESVESILNPVEPLALRVSGLLMLGVVRIYSRKVKYLMTDCTEAMWKIKLAFRPGNADIIELPSNTVHNIDDWKNYGNFDPDADEFTGLAETAFSQTMLSKYNTLKAASGRTIAKQRDTTQDDHTTLYRSLTRGSHAEDDELIDIPGFEGGFEDLIPSPINRSGISEIGTMRGEQRRTRPSQATERSLSLSSAAGVTVPIDDDTLERFKDDVFDTNVVPQTDDFDEFLPPISMAMDISDSTHGVGVTDTSIPSTRGRQLRSEASRDAIPTQPSVEPVANDAAKKTKPKRRAKKQRVAIDKTVELGNKAIKEKMSDLSGIMRRRPDEPMVNTTSSHQTASIEQQLARPSVDGLCPELMELFSMTMTSGPLPFPELSPQKGSEHGREGDADQDNSTSRAEDIEMARDQSIVLGRPSLLDSGVKTFGNSPADSRLSLGLGSQPHDQEFQQDQDMDFQPVDLDEQLPSPIQAEQLPLGALALSTDLNLRAGSSSSAASVSVGAAADSTEAWNPKTAAVLNVLKSQFQEKESVSFNEISAGTSKKLAASCFLEVLQLKTWGYISAVQQEPFADIEILPTGKTFSSNQSVVMA